MNRRPLTDAEITAGLRAYLPAAPTGGLRERISDQVAATPQARRLPWGLHVDRWNTAMGRPSLLWVVLLGLLAAAALGVVVGSSLRTPGPIQDLGRENEADRFVLASHERLADLPAFRLVLLERMEGVLPYEYHYDGFGALREAYGSMSTMLFTREITASRDGVTDDALWVVSEAEDGHPLSRLIEILGGGSVDCTTGWEDLDRAELIGRTTRHVRCVTEDQDGWLAERHLWIDIDSGLPLRAGSPLYEAGSSAPPTIIYKDVAELELAPQPVELFRPDGRTMPSDEYRCLTEGECASPRPAPYAPAPSVAPVVTPAPAPDQGVTPEDLDAFVAAVHAAYESTLPLEIVVHEPRGRIRETLWQRDGRGNYRSVRDWDLSDEDAVTWLTTGGRTYETDPRPDGRVWRDWGTMGRYGTLPPTLRLPTACGIGWTYLGDELVLERPAARIACGLQQFWIDREWLVVTRAHDHDPMLGDHPAAGLGEVVSVTFGPLPEELFAAPPPDSVWVSQY